MNTTSVLSTPPNTRGPSAESLLMTPRASRQPRRSIIASVKAMMGQINDIENVGVQPEPQPIAVALPVAQKMPATPEKTQRLPLPPLARHSDSLETVEPISREEAFLRAPEVRRRRAPPKFRPQRPEECELTPLPKSRFNHLREMGIRYRDITEKERKEQLDSARELRYYQLKYRLSEAKTFDEFNKIKEQFYL